MISVDMYYCLPTYLHIVLQSHAAIDSSSLDLASNRLANFQTTGRQYL